MDVFAPYRKQYGSFIVRNITPDRKKTIKIFQYPINFNETRDLLQIPGVAEQDIRASLLKGELRHKILAGDIYVEASDIDLLQFNIDQKHFLQNAGVVNGLQIDNTNMGVIRREDIELVGEVDDVNTIFKTPDPRFLYEPLYTIIVYKNGVKQMMNDDYFIAESHGPGTGYDTIVFSTIPTRNPLPPDVLTADYYVRAP